MTRSTLRPLLPIWRQPVRAIVERYEVPMCAVALGWAASRDAHQRRALRDDPVLPEIATVSIARQGLRLICLPAPLACPHSHRGNDQPLACITLDDRPLLLAKGSKCEREARAARRGQGPGRPRRGPDAGGGPDRSGGPGAAARLGRAQGTPKRLVR